MGKVIADIDHSRLSFKVKYHGHLAGSSDQYIIRRIRLEDLYASIVQKNWLGKILHSYKTISNTPHYQFLVGKERKYEKYLIKFGQLVGYPSEHTVQKFNNLIRHFTQYLSKTHNEDYIIVERNPYKQGSYIIVDGLHRACILLKSGVSELLVAEIRQKVTALDQLKQYINDFKNDFLEWYTPINVNGIVINERTYPNFVERPEYLNNKERGQSKWKYIIKKNLPDLSGKKVYDIGCNNGLFSILLKESGAKQVTGIDRSEDIFQPSNTNLPHQSNVQQAYFVKNIFILSGYQNLKDIKFIEKDVAKIDFRKLKCDLLYATCILYHFGKNGFEKIIRQASSSIPEIFLQTNLGHEGGELGEAATIKFQTRILTKYGYKVSVDAPKGYNYPIIYAKKYKVKHD